jgi:ribosomal protein L11
LILLVAGLWAPSLAAVHVAGATSSKWERASPVLVVPVAWPLAAALVAPALRHRLARMLVLVAGTLTSEKLREVAKLKMADLNTDDEEMAMRIVAGAARSMGVRVQD